MAKLLLSLVFLLPFQAAASCNTSTVTSACPGPWMIGPQAMWWDLALLCDNPTCHAAIVAGNASCVGTPSGRDYDQALQMCQPCQKAYTIVVQSPECPPNDPVKACNATCQSKFCTAIQNCPTGSSFAQISAPVLSDRMDMLRSSLSTCPCTGDVNATTTMVTTTTTTTTTTVTTTTVTSAECAADMNEVKSVCPNTLTGPRGTEWNLALICDDSTCNSALKKANDTCTGLYKWMLDMCEPCWKASLEVQYAHSECFKHAEPDPAKVCSATCQPKYCNLLQKCNAGSTWGGISAPFVGMEVGMINESLVANGTCPCSDEVTTTISQGDETTTSQGDETTTTSSQGDETTTSQGDETTTTSSQGVRTPLSMWTVAMGVLVAIII